MMDNVDYIIMLLSLTKERFPLLRFILADVPFQNMSLNEQYSDEEQRSSKHENCRHINLIITICANFANVYDLKLTVRYTCPVPSLRLLSLEY